MKTSGGRDRDTEQNKMLKQDDNAARHALSQE